MGWLRKRREVQDAPLPDSALLGRAEVTDLRVEPVAGRGSAGLRTATMTLAVWLDGEAEYSTTVEQRVGEGDLARLAAGQAVVAVRVDPDDHTRVRVDVGAPVPVVTLPPGEGQNSAAWLLEHGRPIKVVLVQSANAHMKTAAGDDLWALTLTTYEGVDEPYRIFVGNGVPATALPLIFPGSKLHARLGDEPDAVVVDWAAGAAD